MIAQRGSSFGRPLDIITLTDLTAHVLHGRFGVSATQEEEVAEAKKLARCLLEERAAESFLRCGGLLLKEKGLKKTL